MKFGKGLPLSLLPVSILKWLFENCPFSHDSVSLAPEEPLRGSLSESFHGIFLSLSQVQQQKSEEARLTAFKGQNPAWGGKMVCSERRKPKGRICRPERSGEMRAGSAPGLACPSPHLSLKPSSPPFPRSGCPWIPRANKFPLCPFA